MRIGAGWRIRSDLHYLGFLGGQNFVELFDVLGGVLLDLGFGSADVVTSEQLILVHLLEFIVGVAPMVADRDPKFLGGLADVPHQLFAALFVELGNGNPDDLAVVHRIESEVGGLNCLFDFAHRTLIVGRDDQQSSLGRGQSGKLTQRRLGAVVVDVKIFQQGGRGASGANSGQLMAESVYRFLHLHLRKLDFLVHGSCRSALSPPRSTRVPIASPITALFILPRLRKLKTMMGRSWSMHIEIAVESITLRFRCSTSM